MITESLRSQMEYNIVCTCIYVEHAYASVCNIIKPQHFSNKQNRAIMTAIETVWPNPIDLITLWRVNGCLNLPIYSPKGIISYPRFYYHCFALVEFDIRYKFKTLLTNELNSKSAVISAALCECIDLLNKQEEDVFACIDTSINYLKSLFAPAKLIDTLEDFSRNVDRGILDMKKAKQVDMLLSTIIDLSGKAVPTHNVLVAQELAQCLAACFLVGPMHEDVYAAISTLKKTLNIS